MTPPLSVEADLTVRGPSGTARIVGTGSSLQVSAGWRLLLSVLLRRRLRHVALATWRALESRGVGVRLRLPGIPALDLDRVSFVASLAATSALAVVAPLLLLS